MDSDIKAQWLQALRSGEYEQTSGALEHGGKFCCLGVLCDLAVKAGVTERSQEADGPVVYGTADGEDTSAGILPDGVKEWSGLPQRNPIFIEDGNVESLAAKNDMGYSFAQIADLIEREF